MLPDRRQRHCLGGGILSTPMAPRTTGTIGVLTVASTVYSAALPTLIGGLRPRFVYLQSLEAPLIPFYALPYHSAVGHSWTINDLAPVSTPRAPKRGLIIDVQGCTHLALSSILGNYDIAITPIENRRIEMIGPPSLRTVVTRAQLGTTASDVTIPNNLAGKRPKYVMIGMESAGIIYGMGTATGDTTAAASLPLILASGEGPIILDVAGAQQLRMASSGTPYIRVAALENGGSCDD